MTLDVRWGPPAPGGPRGVAKGLRKWLVAFAEPPWFVQVDEMAVRRFVVDRKCPDMVAPAVVRRTAMRARVVFEEEV